jgi:hypothetical protein
LCTSLQLALGEADDDHGLSANNNSFSSDLSASERGDSLHSRTSPISSGSYGPRKASLRDLIVSSPGGGNPKGKRSRSSLRFVPPPLPLTHMKEDREYSENNEDGDTSFEFGEDHSDADMYKDTYGDPSSMSHGRSDAFTSVSNFDDSRIIFESSEFFETLELEYVDALAEHSKRHSSIRFAEENDLIDDVVRSSNLGFQAPDEIVLDIFDENKGNIFITEGGSLPRYSLYDDNDDHSIYDDLIRDDDSIETEEESEEKKVLRGLFFSVGGAALFAGIGFVVKRLLSSSRSSEDIYAGEAEMYAGVKQTGIIADAAHKTAHTAELAAEAKLVANAALDASSQAAFNTSSSTLTASGAGAVGAQGATAQ